MLSTFDRLPPRLERLLVPIATGQTNTEIAARLGLAPHTVANYVSDIMNRVGVTTRSKLIVAILQARGEK